MASFFVQSSASRRSDYLFVKIDIDFYSNSITYLLLLSLSTPRETTQFPYNSTYKHDDNGIGGIIMDTGHQTNQNHDIACPKSLLSEKAPVRAVHTPMRRLRPSLRRRLSQTLFAEVVKKEEISLAIRPKYGSILTITGDLRGNSDLLGSLSQCPARRRAIRKLMNKIFQCKFDSSRLCLLQILSVPPDTPSHVNE